MAGVTSVHQGQTLTAGSQEGGGRSSRSPRSARRGLAESRPPSCERPERPERPATSGVTPFVMTRLPVSLLQTGRLIPDSRGRGLRIALRSRRMNGKCNI